MFAALLAITLAPTSWLHLDGCAELDARALNELTMLELSDDAQTMDANVRCEAHTFVVTVRGDLGERWERRIPRAATGDAPERYLAIELAEVFAAATARTVAPAEPEPTPPIAKPPASPPQARPAWVAIEARGEASGRPMIPMAGLSLALGGRIAKRFSVRGAVTGTGGVRGVDLGRVRFGALWASAAALLSFDAKTSVLSAGGGVRAGGVWLNGSTRNGQTPGQVSGRTHAAATWSPMLTMTAVIPIRRAVATVALDGGWTLRAVRGLSSEGLVFAYTGPWVGLSVGGGWSFGR